MKKQLTVDIRVLWYDYDNGLPIPNDFWTLERVWAGDRPDSGLVIGFNLSKIEWTRLIEFSEEKEKLWQETMKQKGVANATSS